MEIFMLHSYSHFLRTKKLAQIYQQEKVMLICCLLLPKYAVGENYNPCMCQNGGIAQTFTLVKISMFTVTFK